MALWTMVSRVLGYVRDAAMLAVFGASAGQGAFLLAWTVPNLFRRLLGEGAVSAAVQPALARAEEEDGEEAAKDLFASFQGYLLLLLLGVLVVGEAVVLIWRGSLDRGPENMDLRRTLWFTACLLPYVVPICMSALASAPQNLRHRFLWPSLAPVLLNVVWIGGLWWITWMTDYPLGRLELLPWVVMVGGLLQWGLQWPGLRSVGWSLRPRFTRADPRRRRAVKAFLPALLGMAALQINVAIDQVLVRELVDEAANNYSFYANRLLHLPLALVGIAAMTGSMPLFSRLAAQRDFPALSTALGRGCESTLLLIMAAGLGLAVIADPLLTLLFQRGAFTAEDVARLTPTVHAYLCVLPFAAIGGLLTRAHQSLGSYRTPAIAAAVSVPINLLLDWILLPQYGVQAAGWATAVSIAFQTLILMLLLPPLGIARPLHLRRLPGVLLPGFGAGAAAYAVVHSGLDAYTFFGLGVAIAAGGAAGAALTWVLRPHDFRDLWKAVKQKV